MNMTLKILDLSTGHLKPSTRDFLSQGPFDKVPLSIMRGPYGFMIWSSGEDHSRNPGIPPELANILGTPMPGIEYVRFDADAERHPRFDWYGDAELIEEAGNPDAPLDNGISSSQPRIGLGESIQIQTDGATIEVTRHPEGDAVHMAILAEDSSDSNSSDYADVSMPSRPEPGDDPSI